MFAQVLRRKKRPITIIVFLLLLAIPVIKYWNFFCCQIDIEEYAQKYSTSQYVLGEGSPQKVSDSELYVFAGYAYSQGVDPTTINFEHPPLAKYFYGLSYAIFKNPYILNIPLFAGLLWLFYQLTKLVSQRWLLRIMALIVFGSLALLQVHLRYALLDLPQLFGYLLFFYGLLGRKDEKLKQVLVGIGLGIVLSVKYPFPVVGLLLLALAYDTVKTKAFKKTAGSVILAAAIYFLSYSVYFLNGHTIFDWLEFEKYRLSWFLGKTDAPKFRIFETLFTGRFATWWSPGQYETTAHWSVLWPTLFLANLLGLVKAYSLHNWNIVSLVSFSLLLLIIYGMGSAASDRFFIALLPFWVLGAAYFVDSLKKTK